MPTITTIKTEYVDVNPGFGLNSQNSIVKNNDALKHQINHILSTAIGERVREPTFGSILPQLLFEPLDDLTAWRLETAVYIALQTWLGNRLSLDFGRTKIVPDTDNNGYIVDLYYYDLFESQIGRYKFLLQS